MIVSVGANGQFTRRVSRSSGSVQSKVTGKIGSSRRKSKSVGSISSRSTFLGLAAAQKTNSNNSSGVSEAIFGATTTSSRPGSSKRLGRGTTHRAKISTSSCNARPALRSVANPSTTNSALIRKAVEAERRRKVVAAAVGGARKGVDGRSCSGQSAGERLGIKRKAYELSCANITLEGLCAGGKKCKLENITRGKIAVIDFWVTRGLGATSIATMDA